MNVRVSNSVVVRLASPLALRGCDQSVGTEGATHKPNQLVARSDASGTTFASANRLAAISDPWEAGRGNPIDCPERALVARGNEGVAGRMVSVDHLNDPHSSIVDAPCTIVIDGTQVKVHAGYHNEWGNVNRMTDIVCMAAIGVSGMRRL